MYKTYLLAACCLCSILIISCSKKNQPQTTVSSSVKVTDINNPAAKKTDTLTAKRVMVKRIKTPVPGVVTVDDRAARKTADGRLYYDLEGHRYWRNYDDGKYYLFNKKMYSDPAFKPH